MGRRPVTHESAEQLAEFLALISSFSDEGTAVRRGLARVAEVLGAEIAALVQGARWRHRSASVTARYR
jgi:hypothetical protein